MSDVFKDMNNWSSKRIEELQSWKLHHQTQIEKLDEEIKRLSEYGTTYDEFMEQIKRTK